MGMLEDGRDLKNQGEHSFPDKETNLTKSKSEGEQPVSNFDPAVSEETPADEETVLAEEPVPGGESDTAEQPDSPEEQVSFEESVPSEELLSAEQPGSPEQPASSEEPISSEESVPSEEPVTAEQPDSPEQSASPEEQVSSEESVTAEQSASPEQPASPGEPVSSEASASSEEPRYQNPWQHDRERGSYRSSHGNYDYGRGDYGTDLGRTYENADAQDATGDGKPHRKKGMPFLRKALWAAAIGICCGICAGVAFLAVVLAGGNLVTRSSESVGEEDVVMAGDSEEAQPQEEEALAETASAAEEDSQEQAAASQQTVTMVVTDVTEVVERSMPSIVSVTNLSVSSTSDYWGQTVEQEWESVGSGIIVGQSDTELLVVTNYHVIEDATTLSVQFINDEAAEAQVKGSSPSMDVAVLAVKLEDLSEETMESITIATLGDSDVLKVGEPVIAIGNALGYGQSVTTGVVSAINRTIDMSDSDSAALIQTDAAINPGNSGGALLNIGGEVVGINSNKIAGATIEGMGYAIPISSARPIIESLMAQETRELVAEEDRGYLGISCINVTTAMGEAYGMPEGVYVAQVYEGTGAELAGLEKGDIITGFEGTSVATQDDLVSAMAYYSAGDVVTLTVMHGNPTEGYEEMQLTVTLTSSASSVQE